MRKSRFKIIKEAVEYFFFIIFIYFMQFLGRKRAQKFCIFLFKLISSKLTANKIIQNNLKYIFQNISEQEIKLLTDKIWDNFACYVGEFAFLDARYLADNNEMIEIEGLENISSFIEHNKPFIIFSGHFANWDFVLFALQKIVNDIGVIYRKINNRFIDNYVRKKRSINGVHLIKKGNDGVKDLLKTIKSNKTLVMLVDQKMNDGIKVPFMGKPAMTSQAIAVIARQYDYPIVPGQIIRKANGNYKVIFHPSFSATKTDHKDADIYDIMHTINEILGEWIISNPSQWFWLHQRWGKPSEMENNKNSEKA